MHWMGTILSDKLKLHLLLKEACKSCTCACMKQEKDTNPCQIKYL